MTTDSNNDGNDLQLSDAQIAALTPKPRSEPAPEPAKYAGPLQRRGQPPGPQSVTLPIAVGDVVDIAGVPCKLVYVNHGKKRLTFTPTVCLKKGQAT